MIYRVTKLNNYVRESTRGNVTEKSARAAGRRLLNHDPGRTDIAEVVHAAYCRVRQSRATSSLCVEHNASGRRALGAKVRRSILVRQPPKSALGDGLLARTQCRFKLTT